MKMHEEMRFCAPHSGYFMDVEDEAFLRDHIPPDEWHADEQGGFRLFPNGAK